MEKFAIVLGTQHGQTRKIGEFLADRLREQGSRVDLFEVGRGVEREPAVADYDCIIVGAPVYAGKFLPSISNWTKAHGPELAQKTTTFFSVSLNAADARPKARGEDDRLLNRFLEQTGLRPRFVASLAGALKYREYGFLVRWLMKRISASADGPTDTSRDYEMTDWSQVEAFAKALSGDDERSPFATSVRLGSKAASAE